MVERSSRSKADSPENTETRSKRGASSSTIHPGPVPPGPGGVQAGPANVDERGAAGSPILDEHARPVHSEQPGKHSPLSDLQLQDLQKNAQKLAQDGQELLRSLKTVVDGARDVVARNVEARPYVTLGAAAGVGYVLGGGLSSALTRYGIRVGSRMVVAKLVKDALEASGLVKVDVETPGNEPETP